MAEVLARRPAELAERPQAWHEQDSDIDTVEVFTDDEDEEVDTTARQHAAGKDVQGIPWERLHFSRQQYRETRLGSYSNYTNLEDEVNAGMKKLDALWKVTGHPSKTGKFYQFWRNHRAVHSSIVHFQLRNLVWATSTHDVYVMLDSCINHWSTVTREVTQVMNLSGGPMMGAALGRVQVSTMATGCGLLAAGGFTGELAVRNLQSARPMSTCRVTASDNGITNGIEIFQDRAGGARIMASNNDNMLRVFDAASLKCISRLECPWAVNYAVVRPGGGGGSLAAAVGDAPEALLLDWASGKTVAQLKGHFDYSFAVAWHPDGNEFATGNQDTTTRVWDVRMTGRGSLAVLKGRMGAIRSLRYSPCGRVLAVAEPADFLTLYNAEDGYDTAQEIDLFGEIAGTSFSPDGDRFFLAIADLAYSSLVEYQLADGLRQPTAGGSWCDPWGDDHSAPHAHGDGSGSGATGMRMFQPAAADEGGRMAAAAAAQAMEEGDGPL